MDFFSSAVNVSFVAAIIVVIQTIKAILKKQGKVVSNNVWKIVVLIMGIPMAAIMQTIDGWPGEGGLEIFMSFLVTCFLYSAAATLLYQTGKLTLDKLFSNGEGKNG